MKTDDIKQLDQQYVMHTYGRNPIVIDHGEGATVYDTDGNAYIDFTSGIGVCSVGYGNEAWAEAIYAQAKKLGHISNLYYTEPCAKLAEQLMTRAGMSRVFFGNSGAEGNEGMIKTARKYSYDKYGEGRATVITLVNSFHGRTITTLKATGQDHFHEFFYPFTEGFKYVECDDFAALKEAATSDVCAIMLELVQGEGGVWPLDPDYVKQVAAFCEEKDLLLLVDEVQTGVGRTGKLFAYQAYGIQPDVVSFAKGIAGGLPMGGFMVNDKCKDVMTAGTHGSTFGGNPIVSSAALTVLDQLSDDVLAEVEKKGEYIKKTIASWNAPCVKSIRGLGLILGIELQGMVNGDLNKSLMNRGLLCLTAGRNVLRMLPPLTISYEEIDKGLEILKSLIAE